MYHKYLTVYPNLLRLLDLNSIRLEFPQEIMPCGKTHNPNHNYQRLQVPPQPWLLNHNHHNIHQSELLYRDPSASSLRRVFGVPLLAKSKRSGYMMKVRCDKAYQRQKSNKDEDLKLKSFINNDCEWVCNLSRSLRSSADPRAQHHLSFPSQRPTISPYLCPEAPLAGHQASAPSLPMLLLFCSKSMLVTVLLTFNASARACGQSDGKPEAFVTPVKLELGTSAAWKWKTVTGGTFVSLAIEHVEMSSKERCCLRK